MFHPSAPASLPLSDSFTLRYVTASSSAIDFTPTMASSEDPLSITVTLLHRLGYGCRSYNRPGMQTALHRVRSRTFIAHLPPLPCRVTERISGFGGHRHLTPLQSLPEVHTKFRWQIRLWFPSDPSLAHSYRIFPPRAASVSFFRHPYLRLHIPSFQGYGWTYTS